MAIARNPGLVVDCDDPQALATFYAALFEWEVVPGDDWWTARSADGGAMHFQQVENYRAPEWPGQDSPQQMHVDMVVDDLDVAEAAVVQLGATKHDVQPGETFRVFLDPAGHPFCLCLS